MTRVPYLILNAGPVSISAHLILEALSYTVGFAIYSRHRAHRGDILASANRSSVVVAAILGAAIGSKLLGWLEDPAAVAANPWPILLGAKTIAAGLSAIRRSLQNGELYRLFLVSYFGWRLVVDFLKPEPSFAGLSSIHWASVAALAWYSRDVVQIASAQKGVRAHG